MKLKPLPAQDGVARLSLSIRSSTSKALDDYLKFYEETYGQAVEKSRLVDAILKDYFESDTSFKAHAKKSGSRKAKTDVEDQS